MTGAAEWLNGTCKQKEIKKIKALGKLELFVNFLLAAGLHTTGSPQSIIKTPVIIQPQSQGGRC